MLADGVTDPHVPDDVEIIARLGESWQVFKVVPGGMGEIYLCVPTEGNRLPVALKSFPRRFLFDPAKRRAFQRECAVAIRASLAIGVLPVYGLQIFDGQPFIAMEAVLPGPRGEVNLRDLLRNGPLSLTEAAFYARFIARAVDSAGQVVPGLVHGDLKPENLLMVLGIPHIADFGIAQPERLRLGPPSFVVRAAWS